MNGGQLSKPGQSKRIMSLIDGICDLSLEARTGTEKDTSPVPVDGP